MKGCSSGFEWAVGLDRISAAVFGSLWATETLHHRTGTSWASGVLHQVLEQKSKVAVTDIDQILLMELAYRWFHRMYSTRMA